MTEPCPISDQSSSPTPSSKFFSEVIASPIRSHSISHSSKRVVCSISSFTYLPQQDAPSMTLAPIFAAVSSACSISFSMSALPFLTSVLMSLSNPPARYNLEEAKSTSLGSCRISTSSPRSPLGAADITIVSTCESLSTDSSKVYRLFWYSFMIFNTETVISTEKLSSTRNPSGSSSLLGSASKLDSLRVFNQLSQRSWL